MNDEKRPFPLDGGRWPAVGGSDGGDGGEADTLGRSPWRRRPGAYWDKLTDNKPQHAPGVAARAKRLRQQMSSGETRMWARLRVLKLNIRRQAPLGRFVVDFIQHAAKVVIEFDGHFHQFVEVKERDEERDLWLRSQGYVVHRIRDIDRPPDLDAEVETVRALIQGRLTPAVAASRPSPPSDPASRGHLPPSRGKGF